MLSRCAEPHELVAAYDADPDRSAGFAAAWSCEVAATVEDLLDRSDVVFVCTWTSEHLAGVSAAVDRGLPVFCEKPLSTDLAGAAELTDLVVGSGLPNQVGLSLR